jgi:hypothetical protein
MKNNKLKEFIVKMFKDENDINEKSIVGFASFIMMLINGSHQIRNQTQTQEVERLLNKIN